MVPLITTKIKKSNYGTLNNDENKKSNYGTLNNDKNKKSNYDTLNNDNNKKVIMVPLITTKIKKK